MSYSKRFAKPGSQAGFSVLELIVALFVMVEVILGVLVLLDSTDRLSRSQTFVSEMQQSMRVAQSQLVRMSRMVGRGNLPLGAMPQGLAISVRNNVGVGVHLVPTDSTTPGLVEGSDVLTLRGVFDTPLYWINYKDEASISIDSSDPTQIRGQLLVYRNALVQSPVENDLSALAAIRDLGLPVPLILVSARSDQIYAVVELDPSGSNLTAEPATVAFKVTGGIHTARYLALSGGTFPANLGQVVLFGILEEHRFYLREEHEIPGLDTSRLAPRLSRAQFYPGTDEVYRNADYWARDIADNVFDLQVALGIDVDKSGSLTDTGDEDDEWLFNAADDDPSETKWTAGLGPAFEPHLFYLRISTLVQTDRPEQAFRAPAVRQVEDHSFPVTFNAEPANQLRRQLRQSLVDLRNVE